MQKLKVLVAAAIVAAFALVGVSAAQAGPMQTVFGDYNCDGAVNGIDAQLVLQISAGIYVPLPCTGQADVNSDGELNPIDAALILQYEAGLITAFPQP